MASWCTRAIDEPEVDPGEIYQRGFADGVESLQAEIRQLLKIIDGED